jgi:hypothetical protein
MAMSHRTALLLSLGVMLFTTFGDPPVISRPASLPEITMTSGGGFDPSSQEWTIAPDGSWTWARTDRSMHSDEVQQPLPRFGRLTEAQRNELAVLATDPRLRLELRRPPRPCHVSDGDAASLDVGSLRYLAGWCSDYRPHIKQLRTRIMSFTAAS